MNKTTKIIAAVFLTAVSSVSFAKTELAATGEVYKIGDNTEQGYDPGWVNSISDSFNNLKSNRIVFEFNVRSTNKSKYNAMYLLNEEIYQQMQDGNIDICDTHENNPDEDAAGSVEGKPLSVMYLPYSPHKEIHNDEEWGNGWRSVHTVVHVPNWMTNSPRGALLFCSRDKDGDVVGDLDDFEIKDIVVHLNINDEVLPN